MVKFREITKIRVGAGFLKVLSFLVTFFVLKTSKHVTKHKSNGDVISDHFFMLWFLKDSLAKVGFRTFRGRGPGFLIKIVDFGGAK